jgi:hypothetical protein
MDSFIPAQVKPPTLHDYRYSTFAMSWVVRAMTLLAHTPFVGDFCGSYVISDDRRFAVTGPRGYTLSRKRKIDEVGLGADQQVGLQ